MENWRLEQTIRNATYTYKKSYEAYRNSELYRKDINYYYNE